MKAEKGEARKRWFIYPSGISLVALALAVLDFWPVAANWVISIHWAWFLGIAVLFSIKPVRKLLYKD